MADFFFGTSTPPPEMAGATARLEQFLSQFRSPDSPRIVVVTGGGTRVNLEKNTVRFIDNFSSGTRAASCVEQFLEQGYAVVFVHRQGCVAPFARHLSAALQRQGDASSGGTGGGFDVDFALNGVQVKKDESGKEHLEFVPKDDASLSRAIKSIQALQKHRPRLLLLPFVTVCDYFFLLRICSQSLAPFTTRGILFLVAAVSDFYIPDSELSLHKIQSREGPLHLVLQQTPKLISSIRRDWAPQALCVSFKLETDADILLAKSRAAIDQYGVHLVVANQLSSRNESVLLVYPKMETKEIKKQATEGEGESLDDRGGLEEGIVREVVLLHGKHIAAATE